ncbi:MAG: TolC family protein [Cyclobacteriaceae bacterium]
MSIPIFNSRFNASKRKTEIMRQAYLKREEETVNELITQYEMVWFELERNRQYMELYINQISETRQVLNLLFSSYSNEGNEFEELLRMQQQLLKYEKLHVSALTDYKVAEARLNFITAKSY